LTDTGLHNEKELLFAVAEGSKDAFTTLFDHYSPKVLHVAGLFTHSLSEAEDIVQDVFMKVWLKRDQLKSVADFNNWLFILTRNLSINALNKIARAEVNNQRVVDYLPLSDEPPGKTLELKDVQNLILEALLLLTDQQRRVFELSRLRGMSREEIARELDLSPNTVKMHLVRATRLVRAYLSSRMDFFVLLCVLKKFL
jgi:RNA polymerase sigma-70 factor (ECF subfamily)